MSTISSGADQRVLLDNISWSTYLAILDDAENRRGRIAYDRGVLEIMSPSKLHENVKSLIGRLIEVFTEVHGIEMLSAGSTTFKREDVERGFEPDECYYIAHASAVHGKDDIDLMIDPPPDLVIEVDVSRSSLNKFGIYGVLGVPEVWRYAGDLLQIHVLQEGQYEEANRSQVLPQFPIEKLIETLNRRASIGETALIREFREWISQHGIV